MHSFEGELVATKSSVGNIGVANTESIADTVSRLRATFDSGITKSTKWRRGQLSALARMVEDNKEEILAALAADIRKSSFEAFVAEVASVQTDIEVAEKNLSKWMRSEKVSMPFLAGIGASAKVMHEPLGESLIIGAWNYPIMLTLGPLVGAIAAGNTAVIKPSELVPNSAAILDSAIKEYLDPDAFAVIQGGIPETTELLAQRFDLIFFTGSPQVGKIVMRAAAENLTPVVLELGGKSPGVVCADANLEVAARRLVWGKFFNAGQTCIGVDYALIEESVYEEFLEKATQVLAEFYGDEPQQSPDFPRIVNHANFDRITGLIHGEKIVVGGEMDASELYIAPTILRDVTADSPIMQEEIFGPVLPTIPIKNMEQAIAVINAGEKPLAAYVFTGDSGKAKKFLQQTSSGGACVNDVLTHMTIAEAPFGGVGTSGIGCYHGYDGYLAFTHRRTVLQRSTSFDPSLRYPPYTDMKLRLAKKLV